jgi:hypothetical protein
VKYALYTSLDRPPRQRRQGAVSNFYEQSFGRWINGIKTLWFRAIDLVGSDGVIRVTLSDHRGRVMAEASNENQDAELVGNLPLRETHTLYTRWGDWFAWLDLVALAAWLALAFLPRHMSAYQAR